MTDKLISPNLNLLRNHIDVTKVPFSDRGSRLLIYQQPSASELYIKLAERLTGLVSNIEAYLQRPPFIRNLCFIDEDLNPLEFKVESNPHILKFSTRIGEFSLVFQDKRTLSFGIPADKKAGIRFHVSPQFWQETQKGGVFKGIRNLAYTSNGEPLSNNIKPEDGGFTVEYQVMANEDCAINISIGENLDPIQEVTPFSTSVREAETRWQNWFSNVPPVLEPYAQKYAYAWWIMANNLISPHGRVAYEAMMPSKINYVGLWLWDSAIHALAFRHLDPELARNQIRAMLDCQLPDGMLPDAVYDEGVVYEIEHPIRAEVTKPPILAWAALKLHETDPDLELPARDLRPAGALERLVVQHERRRCRWLGSVQPPVFIRIGR